MLCSVVVVFTVARESEEKKEEKEGNWEGRGICIFRKKATGRKAGQNLLNQTDWVTHAEEHIGTIESSRQVHRPSSHSHKVKNNDQQRLSIHNHWVIVYQNWMGRLPRKDNFSLAHVLDNILPIH